MSTLTVSNVSDGSLSIPTTYVTNGSAKAWVNFDGTGTIAARDSLNVSSLTDNGTGDYTVNFTNAFGAADYGASASASKDSTSVVAIFGVNGNTTPTTSAVRTIAENGAGAAVDREYCTILAHGDLA